MKALILAAGRGTRVRPLTDSLPKPMIPIINKPMMEFLVEHLKRFGVRQIMVNTSYMAPLIENHFGDGQRFGVQMAYSFEGREHDGQLLDEPLGSAGAIRKIHDHSGFFDETFLVLCGDAIIDLDLDELLRFHRSKKALATLALREVPLEEVSNYGVVVQDDDGRVTDFQEKPAQSEARSRMINTGIYIFEPQVVDKISAQGPYDIGSELFPRLASEGGLYAALSSTPWQWLDIGRVPDFHAVTMQALRGEIDNFELPGQQVRPGIRTGLNVKIDFSKCNIVPPVYIGGSAEIQDGSTLIGPVVIGAGAVVESGAHLEKTVVMDYTRVGAQAYFNNKIVGSRFCVDADGTVLDGRHTDTAWLFADSRNMDADRNADQQQIVQLLAQASASA